MSWEIVVLDVVVLAVISGLPRPRRRPRERTVAAGALWRAREAERASRRPDEVAPAGPRDRVAA